MSGHSKALKKIPEEEINMTTHTSIEPRINEDCDGDCGAGGSACDGDCGGGGS